MVPIDMLHSTSRITMKEFMLLVADEYFRTREFLCNCITYVADDLLRGNPSGRRPDITVRPEEVYFFRNYMHGFIDDALTIDGFEHLTVEGYVGGLMAASVAYSDVATKVRTGLLYRMFNLAPHAYLSEAMMRRGHDYWKFVFGKQPKGRKDRLLSAFSGKGGEIAPAPKLTTLLRRNIESESYARLHHSEADEMAQASVFQVTWPSASTVGGPLNRVGARNVSTPDE